MTLAPIRPLRLTPETVPELQQRYGKYFSIYLRNKFEGDSR